MKKIAVIAFLLVVLGGVFAVAGNTDADKVPKYIWIQTEQYQPAKEAAYMKLMGVFKETMGPSEFYWLAGMPLVGTGNEVTYVMFPNDFATIDKIVATFEKVGADMHQKNAAVVSDGMAAIGKSHSVLAEYQPELSINPGQPAPAQVTRWRVAEYQVRPGMVEPFMDLVKEMRELHLKANDTVHVMVYRVIDGAPGPMFLVVMPLRTLADLDQVPSAAFQALMTPLVKKHIYDVVKNTVVSQKSTLFALQPRLSYPPKNFLAENPGFWTVKESAPVVAKGKKSKKVVEPTAMKEKGAGVKEVKQ